LRHIADYPDDVAAIADALGYERFAVLGYSGGGPYALACAAALPDRLTVAGGMAAAGPPDGPRGFDGLAPSDVRMLRLAQRRPRLAGAALRVATVVVARLPRLAVRSFASELGEADRRKVEAERPDMTFFAESCRQGPAGAVLDYKLWAEPWGFSLAAIRVPVHLWQGDDDHMVPMHHAEWMAEQIPGAVVHPLAGVGHISIQDHVAEMLDVLVPRSVL
jgi:pimeloyl-ACP methyl ester carboxylesterase